jgi:tetratricopeptide (TPR) repeat protein
MPLEMRVKPIVQVGIVLAGMLTGMPASSGSQAAPAAASPGDEAYVLEQQGKYPEAEAEWRTVIQAQPANADAYAHLGFLEARLEHYAEAVAFYRKALALNPAMPGLRLNLGLSLFKSGALKQAIQTFAPLLKTLPPSSPEALRLTTLMGLAHYGLGEYAAAVPQLKLATAADAQSLPLRLALAHSCLWSKQYKCVLDVYHEILTLNAESAEADMLAGEALDEMKDSAGATQQFRAAVKADPREPNVHFGLGYLLWGQMQYEEAGQEFKAELGNNPEHAQALVFLADTQMRLNHPESAPALLEKALRIDPGIELAHLDLGILYGDAGRKDDALRELQIAAKLSPEDQNAHFRLGRFYQAEGRKDEAKVEFEKTRSLQKAADETVFRKLHEAQAKGKPAGEPTAAPAAQ